jgi:hypothetical protein
MQPIGFTGLASGRKRPRDFEIVGIFVNRQVPLT